jgi:hypothetical protein
MPTRSCAVPIRPKGTSSADQPLFLTQWPVLVLGEECVDAVPVLTVDDAGGMRKLRIQRACRLLIQTERSVAPICFEVGYENVSNFNRHCRHEMNQTPSDYRQAAGLSHLH